MRSFIRCAFIFVFAVGLNACSAMPLEETSDEVVTVSHAALVPSPIRYIPVRAIALVDDNCTPETAKCSNEHAACSGSRGLTDSQYNTYLTDTITYISNH